MGFKQIRRYLRKKAFVLRFLDFPGAPRTLRKRAKRAEKGRKRPISADFRKPLKPPFVTTYNGVVFAAVQIRASHAPKKSPAPKISLRGPPPTPSPLPRRSPRTPSKKVTHGPEPLQNQSPRGPPEPPHGEGPLGDLFWIDPFLDSRLFFA